MENNHIEVIGIDHGWANMKTVSQVFTSGVKEITTEPALYDNVLEYEVELSILVDQNLSRK